MSANYDTPTSLIIHGGNYTENSNETSITAASSASGNEIVLDALSYVEALDPNYEHYALSLVEAEMQQQQQQQQRVVGDDNDAIHPSLYQSVGLSSGDANTNNFAKRSPLAAAAYEALVQKKRRQQNPHHLGSEGIVDDTAATSAANDGGYDTIAEIPSKNIIINSSSTIQDLQAAIAQAKIQHEYQRLRYTNLELHSLFETPPKYSSYLSSLEKLYTNTTAMAVEQQRLVVDGINGTRMEEQSLCMNKLMGLQSKYGMLLDKNWKLGKALKTLQSEVDGLKKQVLDA